MEVFKKSFHIENSQKKLQFTCNECDVILNSERMLKIHVKIHHAETVFSCNKCENSFETKWLLNQHQQNVHLVKFVTNWLQEDPKFRCRQCNIVFSKQSNLKKHTESVHWNCKICPFTCYYKQSFVNHMRVHAEEEQFS